jgi:hypothetical protein
MMEQKPFFYHLIDFEVIIIAISIFCCFISPKVSLYIYINFRIFHIKANLKPFILLRTLLYSLYSLLSISKTLNFEKEFGLEFESIENAFILVIFIQTFLRLLIYCILSEFSYRLHLAFSRMDYNITQELLMKILGVLNIC